MKKIVVFLALVIISKGLLAQVNPQTGSAIYNLPLFSWNDDKGRLTSVISLNYNSGSGLKVNDVASNIGQGWNLIAGGMITRMQNGEPDDQKPYVKDENDPNNTDDIARYPPGYLYNDLSASGCHTGLTKYPLFKDKNHIYKQLNSVTADKELDHFAFQFNGRTGLFVLSKNNGDIAIPLGDTKMKIWFEREDMPGIRTTIKTFHIQDENGLKYTFSDHDLTKVLKTDYSDANGTVPLTQPTFQNGGVYHESSFDNPDIVNPYIINGWYLTEVEDVLTHRKIFFHYTIRELNVRSGTSISYFKEKKYSLITHLTSVSKTPDIRDIEYPDGHQVLFEYGSNERFDFAGEFALAAVNIKYNGRYLSRFELNSSYFISRYCGMPTTSYSQSLARLCLKSIKKVGVDLQADDPPYMFDYYMGSNENGDQVPPPFSHLKDIWGYYNADLSAADGGTSIPLTTALNDLKTDQLRGLCFIRNDGSFPLNPKPGYAKNGLLKQITFPASGSITYEYEQNSGRINDVARAVGGVHVSRTKVSSGVNLIDCDDNTVITDYKYVMAPGASESSLWGLEMPVNSIGTTMAYYEPLQKHYHWGIRHGCFPLGCCKYTYQYPGILSREQAVDLTGHQKFMETLELVLDIVSVITTIMDVVTVCLISTGPGEILAVILDAVLDIVNILITCLHDYSNTYYTTVFYNSDLNGMNPLPVQFKSVEVTESSGANGKTFMEFTSSSDYAVWEPSNPLFSSKQRFAFWAYGLLKKNTVYNAAGQVVSQVQNDYDFSHAKSNTAETFTNGAPVSITIDDPTCKCLVYHNTPQKSIDWVSPNDDPGSFITNSTSSGDLKAEIKQFYTGRVMPRSSYERTYKTGSSTEFVETATDYGYNSHNYLPSIITSTQSNGDKNTKVIIYSGDAWEYGAGAGDDVTSLAQNNIINIPVVTRTTVSKANESPIQTYALNETVTRYRTLANGDIKPATVFENRRSAPEAMAGSILSNLSPMSYTDPAYKMIQSIYYDGAGNVINIKDEGHRQVSSIYDYDDKFVVASIINADQILPKEGSCYSSFETAGLGNWILQGTASYTADISITGNRSFILTGSNSFLGNANSDGHPYTISLWAATNDFVISNGTQTPVLEKSGPTINGLTFYEYSLPSVANEVLVSGNTTIDELRLYPAVARMRTVTYDPLIGKTSECDENNRITYYEYDEHGRLRFIKDDRKNIVKMYEYNYGHDMQGPPACSNTVVYTNPEITQYFIKNDCEKDEIGESVPYTLLAGTITSTISQDIVDQKVQHEFDLKGQENANATGHCYHLYKNAEISQEFTKEGCDVGYMGTTITYAIPAARYTSVISQADADHQAWIEINANGQAYANFPGHADCIVDTDPDLIGTGNTSCSDGHYMVEVIDQNPNSSTHDQVQNIDEGLSASCGADPVDITYKNSTSYTATIHLGNVTNGLEYTFSLPAGTNTTAGQVPAGNYEVHITTSAPAPLNIGFYSDSQTGSFYLSSVNVGVPAGTMVSITN